MTWTADADVSGRDEVDVARSVRLGRLRRVLASAAVGAVLLGAVGAVVGLTRDEPVDAQALVQTSPDPTAVQEAASGATGGDPAAENATYLETELVYLQGDQLADQVARATGTGRPDLQATRVGDSNVVQLTVTATSGAAARKQVQSAADLYVQDRRQRLTARIAEQTTAVNSQVDATNAALDALARPAANGVDPQAQQRTALTTQLSDQLSTRDALQRAGADASSIAQVVQRATVQPGGSLSSVVLLALAGLVVGALLGAAVPLLASSFGSRLRDEKDVTDLGAPIVSPTLTAGRGSARRRARMERAVQLQALSLTVAPGSGGSLAVLSATTGAGAGAVALQHARHATRYRPTLLVCASDVAPEGLADLGVERTHLGLADLVPAPGETVTARSLQAASQSTVVPNLYVLTAGSGAAVDLTAMSRALAGGLLQAARQAGWGVVLDTAPLDRSDIGLVAAQQSTDAVLVVDLRRSRSDDVERALRVLRPLGATFDGVVVTNPGRGSGRAPAPSGTAVPSGRRGSHAAPEDAPADDRDAAATQPGPAAVAAPGPEGGAATAEPATAVRPAQAGGSTAGTAAGTATGTAAEGDDAGTVLEPTGRRGERA